MLRLLLSATLLPLAGAVTAQQPAAVGKPRGCVPPSALRVQSPTKGAGVHKLDQEPPAKQYLTVLRSVDGCPVPVVVRRGIGEKK